MDCILLKNGYDTDKLIQDYKIAEYYHKFINPDNFKGNSFVISDETHGWEAIPLHTIDGIEGNKGTIPKNIDNNIFKPNNTLLKCKYFQEILDELNTEIYLVRIMKLKTGGYIAPHIDKYINDKDKIIRCQIPILTSKEVDFYFGNKKYYLESGNLYFLNVGEVEHYVRNNSKIDRITLVIDLKPSSSIKKIINYPF